MTDHSDLVERTRAWIEGDPDEKSRQDLEALIAAEDWESLSERMDGALEFGTAGIRGRVEAGSNRMNRAVVIRTTAGLSDFLLANRAGPVVVGFDGRTSSEEFADDTVGVLVAAGHEVRYFTEPVPTPLVAFTARRLRAAAAVVVTASHNPPADNGYKVYDSNGAQIIPPVDSQIASAIAAVGPAVAVPRTEEAMSGASPAAVAIDADEAYVAYRAEVDAVRTRAAGSDIAVAYTPIHGVGWRVVERLFRDAGYKRLRVVEAQRDPDGSFPTVAFPNPEEPGAMDLVMELGDRIDADLVIANDPDADRLAVALPEEDGSWRLLTGNQIGVLMADWLLEHWDEEDRPLVINSIVSSPMLATIAEARGARFEQTLTGFKWIANAAMDLEAAGEGRFCCGYEEALGYSVGQVVRDKDGMSAALVFCDMAATLMEEGSDVGARLEDLYRRSGLWVSTQLSAVRPGSEGLAEIEAVMQGLGSKVPDELAGRSVVSSTDYRRGADDRPRWLAATPLVALDLEGGGRVLIRPSGTEPKLKIYVDLPGDAGDDPRTAEEEIISEAESIAKEAAVFLGL
ncbi:MAG TPA: phospho-sugar mutase [Acidimicrobiia bacterium]|nr:phospho-sugar mutase [Acidimicrobiia bacterium]